MCKTKCETHVEPARPWNAAVELVRDASVKITVK
jgi:hypothetical protein